jgi:hypothetical protein
MSISTWLAHYEHQRMLQQLAQQQQAAIQCLSLQQGPWGTGGAAGGGPMQPFAVNQAPGLLQLWTGTYCSSAPGVTAGLDGASGQAVQNPQAIDPQQLGGGGVHAGGWQMSPWAP